jgi:transposase-like protein
LVLVATEAGGRVRLAHAANNNEATLRRFADGQIAPAAEVSTDGLASYNERSLGEQSADQSRAARERRAAGLPLVDLASEALALGHTCRHGRRKHLQVYLDEFAFRHNRGKTNGVDRIAARVIEGLVASEPLPGRMLVEKTTPCRWFAAAQPELTRSMHEG